MIQPEVVTMVRKWEQWCVCGCVFLRTNSTLHEEWQLCAGISAGSSTCGSADLSPAEPTASNTSCRAFKVWKSKWFVLWCGGRMWHLWIRRHFHAPCEKSWTPYEQLSLLTCAFPHFAVISRNSETCCRTVCLVDSWRTHSSRQWQKNAAVRDVDSDKLENTLLNFHSLTQPRTSQQWRTNPDF